MFTWLTKRAHSKRTARQLYGTVVTQAREPGFYRDMGVADTPEGRYELIALHLVLLLERLGAADVGDEELRREIVETFVTDMDDAMREMGVGDVNVPKKVKKAAGGVYARAGAYRAALAEPDDASLASALLGYVYQGAVTAETGPLAAYVRRCVAHLAAIPAATLRAGTATFAPVFT
jgi:cytochrome b pre-mRNA-processing protein 3